MTDQSTKWFLTADYFQACNCDYGCPCEFEAPPTMGYCEGMGAWRIHEGHYGDVKLDGLAFAFSAHWPGRIHEGNGTVQLFFDERADQAQREALLNIASGQDGGMPFEIIVTTFSTILDPLYVPFDFHVDGSNSRVKIGDQGEMAFEPIKNPVTGEEESIRIEHGTGFIFKRADCVSNKICDSRIPQLSYSWPDKNGFVTTVEYGN